MNFQSAVLTLVVAFVVASPGAGAHHSFDTEFDRTRSMGLEGTVRAFEWINPHAYLYVDVIDDSGESATWAIQMGAPGVMSRLGWSPDSVRTGDVVHIVGFRARESADTRGLAHLITLPDGETLQASRAFQRPTRP